MIDLFFGRRRCITAALVGWSLRPPAPAVFADVLPASAEVRWRAGISSDIAPEVLAADGSSVAVIAGGELIVLDAVTGEGRWKQDLPTAVRHEVGLFGGTVVASSRDVSSWTIAAYDVTSGVPIWDRTHDDTACGSQLHVAEAK